MTVDDGDVLATLRDLAGDYGLPVALPALATAAGISHGEADAACGRMGAEALVLRLGAGEVLLTTRGRWWLAVYRPDAASP